MSFTVYKASAGSGKTFTLVADYLGIALLDNRKFAKILALTFTNKAAAEMKERILSYLKLLIQFPNLPEKEVKTCQSLFEKIHQKTKYNQVEIQIKSKELLQNILHHYSEFSVGTIDSFFHKIIRNFANDLKIPVNFEIEMHTEKVFNEAVFRLVEHAVENDFLMRALIDFAIKKLEDGKSWNIQNQLRIFSSELLKEKGPVMAMALKHLTIEDWLNIIAEISKKIKWHENNMSATAGEACNMMKNNNLTVNDFVGQSKGIYPYFAKIQNKRYDKIEANNTIIKNFEEGKLYQKDVDENTKNCISSITPQLTALFNKIQAEVTAYRTFSIIQKNIYECALLNEINQYVEQYKAEENILFIKDFNEKIFNEVIQESIPFIYERIGEKYEHLLIDEFQDTSQMQWHNILPLIEHSLASRNYNLIVGDAKQAIYRWRNGEVEQFIKLPEIVNSQGNEVLEQREKILKENYNEVSLSFNNRSCKEIVDFNNDFFTFLQQKIDNSLVKKVYDKSNLIQQYDEAKTGGWVTINFIQGEDANLYFEKVENLVRMALSEGFNYKDIAILCRKNKEGCAVARHLTRKGIPVVSADSLLLRSSPEVQFIIALMQYFVDSKHTIAFATIIRFLTDYLAAKKNAAIEFNVFYKDSVKTIFNFESLCNHLLNFGINLNIGKLYQLSLSEWCEEIIRSFELHKDYNLFVNYFLDRVVEYEQKNSSSIVGFLEFWEEIKKDASVVLSAEADAVQIMTIHKSKGLQFPVVIFPFAEGKFEMTNKGLWLPLEVDEVPMLPVIYAELHKEFLNSNFASFYEDEHNKSVLDILNVLYVVHTRPSQQLHVITKYIKDTEKDSKKESDAINFQTWYKAYCKSKGFTFSGDDNIYSFGGSKKNEKSNNNGCNQDKLDLQFISADWRKKIQLTFRTKYGSYEHGKAKGKEYGIVIHKILSEIQYASDLDKALQNALISGIVEDFQVELIKQKMETLLANDEIACYFEPGLKIKTEAEILLPSGEQYRPDRVVFDADKVTIIDYKTGKDSGNYIAQVQQYADVIRKMGYTNVSAMLLFIDDIKIEKVV